MAPPVCCSITVVLQAKCSDKVEARVTFILQYNSVLFYIIIVALGSIMNLGREKAKQMHNYSKNIEQDFEPACALTQEF